MYRNIIPQEALTDNFISDVTYKQWISVDRTALETLTKKSEDFVDNFCDQLSKLVAHDFIAKQQSSYWQKMKESLKIGEFLVVCDFAENYAFVVQDSTQGFHWSNNQATIHPIVVYYKSYGDNELRHFSFVIISEHLKHNTVAVHLFKKKLVNFMKEKFQDSIPIDKIIYFSDGAASQYKNKKNFINLTHHFEDFQYHAEWHFFATSHGKGPCDGVGGTVKRLASRASLQLIGNSDPIQTPLDLYNWACSYFRSISFAYCTSAEHQAEESILQNRFDKALTVRGTLKLHAVIPISHKLVKTKLFSASEKFESIKIMN